MSKSHRLRLSDVRAVYRLIGECRDLGADSRDWREHMFVELCRILGARVGIGGEVLKLWTGPDELLETVDVGWENDDERTIWASYAMQRFKDGPVFQGMKALTVDLRTRSRPQLVEDRLWYRSIDFNEYLRFSRIDQCLLSFYTRPDDPEQKTNGITLHRSVGDRKYSRRELRIIHLFHSELGPMIGRQLASAHEASARDLSPRAQETLHCLLEGDSEKQIGRRLCISQNTVHHYVKTIYQHFRVNSRAELMALWMRRNR